MADKPKPTPMRLRITSCLSVYSGVNQKGDSYQIYEIQACKENGEVVQRKLRSFEDLPLEVLDLNVSKYDSEKHGESFTLARKDKPNTHQRIDEMARQLSALEYRVGVLEGEAGQQATTQAPPSAAPDQAELDARFGADAPF